MTGNRDKIDLVEIQRGKWMTEEEADRCGYNWWLRPGRPKKGASFWGPAGITPIIVLVGTIYVAYLIGPAIHGGVHSIMLPIFQAIGLK